MKMFVGTGPLSRLALLLAVLGIGALLALSACGGRASTAASPAAQQTAASALASGAEAGPATPAGPGWIVFQRATGVGVEAPLYVVRPDGTGLRRLGDDQGADPVWSPDGSRIAYTASGYLWVVNADGSGPHSITPAGAWAGAGDDPSWSPDGERIVVAMPHTSSFPRHLVVVDVDDGESTVLRVHGENPVWARDGRIYFAARGGIFSVDADGGDATLITATAGWWTAFAVSPDGRWLALSDGEGITRLAANGHGKEVVVLEELPRSARPVSLAWSPNGRRIAFAASPITGPFYPTGWPRGSRLYFAYAFGSADQSARLITAEVRVYDPAWGPEAQ